MAAGYRHTQVGWVTLGVLAVVGGGLLALFTYDGVSVVALVTAGVLAVVGATFGALTIQIQGTMLSARFGVAPLNKRIDLMEVVSASEVRNRWFYGWGIRLVHTGWMWNTSGLSAVELRFQDGHAFRLGTDEPQALLTAIRRAAPHVGELTAEQRVQSAVGPAWVPVVVAAFVLVLGVVLTVSGYQNTRPIEVHAGESGIEVDGGIYGVDLELGDITNVQLLDGMPRVEWRTNGFAVGGRLRGFFQVTDLGRGRLFVRRGHPPYLLVRTADSFVILNFEDANRTRGVYETLVAAGAMPRP